MSAQLDSRKADLSSVLSSIIRTKSVLDDLQFFEQGLSGLSGETPLSLGDGLALTTLRQRALTVASESFTVQIDSASFAGFTVSKALEATTQMRAGLQAQLTRLQSDQSGLEQEIPQLQRDLENANAQLSQFSLKRDQSWGLYTGLFIDTTASYHSAGAKFESGKRERGGCASRESGLAKDGDEYRPGRNGRADAESLRGAGSELVAPNRVGWIQLGRAS